jgi:hypothetical protein
MAIENRFLIAAVMLASMVGIASDEELKTVTCRGKVYHNDETGVSELGIRGRTCRFVTDSSIGQQINKVCPSNEFGCIVDAVIDLQSGYIQRLIRVEHHDG